MTIKELMRASKDELLVEQSKLVGIVEKALGLACEDIVLMYCSDYCGTEKDCDNCRYKKQYTPSYYITKAKENK